MWSGNEAYVFKVEGKVVVQFPLYIHLNDWILADENGGFSLDPIAFLLKVQFNFIASAGIDSSACYGAFPKAGNFGLSD